MTLIITHVSQRLIFQSGDFRLTDYRTGRLIDYWAQKQIIVQRQKWTALVGFCGVAHTGREYVPDWIAGRLGEIAFDAPFDELLEKLSRAETWLAGMNPKHRALSFSVGAFVETKPVFALISNYEAIGRPPKPLFSLPSALVTTQFRPKKNQLFLAGRPNAVSPKDRAKLRAVFRDKPDAERGYAALAEVNARASTRDNTVGAPCFTSYVTALGEHGGIVHGWPDDKEYLPVFVNQHGFPMLKLRPALDDQGKPKSIQMRATSGSSLWPSEDYYRIALEEKPEDPPTLSNYGNWLREHNKPKESEAAYRKAIAVDNDFAMAHSNLGLLLEERDRLDEAEAEHRRAVELEPTSQIYLAHLASFLWRRRKATDEAEKLLHAALEIDRNAYIVARLAWFNDRGKGDAASAAEGYAEALRLEPNDKWTLAQAAMFASDVQDDSGLARQYFEQAVEGDSPEPGALVEYSAFEIRSGNYEAAAKLAKRALRTGRNRPDALANLAAARSLNGEDEHKVELMYREVIDQSPGHVVAAVNLAQMLLRRGGASDEAAALLQSVVGQPDLTDEIRMEMLFYRYAYLLDGDADALVELGELSRRGVRVLGWDLTCDADQAIKLGRDPAEVVKTMELVLGGTR